MPTTTPTTPEAAFLQVILETPDDMAPRLMYADWLEERNDPRGEFIRVQCGLACWWESDGRVRGESWHRCCMSYGGGTEEECRPLLGDEACDYHALRRREREMFGARTAPGWAGDFYTLLSRGKGVDLHIDPSRMDTLGNATKGLFRRGFVEVVALSAADWLAHGPKLVRAAPLREVRLSDKEPMGGFGQYWWATCPDESTGRHPHALPRQLCRLLGHANYGRPEDSQADASQACLAWARLPAPV